MGDVSGRIARAATLSLLVAHLALTVLYNTPPNPLRLLAEPVLAATIDAYFPQNWALFAPTPVSENRLLLVRPLSAEEAAESDARRLPSDGWYDLSTPLWARWQRDRLSAYDRLGRAQGNAIRVYLGGTTATPHWLEACRRGDSTACGAVEEMLARARQGASTRLGRIGASFCGDLRLPPQQCAALAFRVREVSRVPWSARRDGRPEVREIDLGIVSAPEGVAASGLYRP